MRVRLGRTAPTTVVPADEGTGKEPSAVLAAPPAQMPVTQVEATTLPRILLVEDEPLVRIALSEEITALGFGVEDAGSATEALQKLDRAPGVIQVAIIDYNLPDRKGDALTAELRTILPELPVVIVSAYRYDMLRACFGQHEQVLFLGKPYRILELVPLLHVLGVDPAPELAH